MSGLVPELKRLITRLAKREVKLALAKSRKLRGENQSLRAKVKSLESTVARLVKATAKTGAAVSIPKPGDEAAIKRLRFTAKGIKALRKKTRLSQTDFGKLIGASTLSVSNWELGKALPRKSSDAFRKLVEIREAKMGVREAKRRLGRGEETPKKEQVEIEKPQARKRRRR